jgi:CubicO group peptidase (beta-lactamase class C family)
MTLRRTLLCLLVAGLLAPAAASARSEAEVRAEIVRVVAGQIPGAVVRDRDGESLEGTPGIAELAAGRAQVMMDPAFWSQVVGNLLVSRTVVLPKPIDLVKPEMYLPTVTVKSGGSVWPLPRRPVDLDGITYEWQGRTKTLRDFVTSTETDIVAFVHDGAIVDDLYANGWSAEVRHQPWSVTKSFISTVVGIALDEGRVASVLDPIDRYIGELRGTAWEGVTIQNLLEMESGVHWDENTPVLAVNTQVEQWIQAALDMYTDGALGQTRNEFLKALPKVAPQGTKFSYNSGNTQVLAWLAETVYRKPFNEIISEKLWIPVGMEADARMMTDRVGDAIASQGLYSRVFDLARFGELFRNDGRTPDGRQIVSRSWVREATTMTRVSEGKYAYQWWSGEDGGYKASGFQGNKISVTPQTCLTGVRLSHTLGANLSDGFEVEMGADEWAAAYKAVNARLGGCPPARPAATPHQRARVRLAVAKRLSRRAVLRRGALRVRLRAPGARRSVRIVASARRRGKTVRVARRVLRVTGRRAVSVPLTRAGRALLRADRAVAVTLRVKRAGRTTSRRIVLR